MDEIAGQVARVIPEGGFFTGTLNPWNISSTSFPYSA